MRCGQRSPITVTRPASGAWCGRTRQGGPSLRVPISHALARLLGDHRNAEPIHQVRAEVAHNRHTAGLWRLVRKDEARRLLWPSRDAGCAAPPLEAYLGGSVDVRIRSRFCFLPQASPHWLILLYAALYVLLLRSLRPAWPAIKLPVPDMPGIARASTARHAKLIKQTAMERTSSN